MRPDCRCQPETSCDSEAANVNPPRKSRIHKLKQDTDDRKIYLNGKLEVYLKIQRWESNLAEKLAELRLVPTFFFVDPWGYAGLSSGLIKPIIQNWGCDCVFFFNYNRINMGLPNEKVRAHMDALVRGTTC